MVIAVVGLALPAGARAGCDLRHFAGPEAGTLMSALGFDALGGAGALTLAGSGAQADPMAPPPPCLAGSCRGDSPTPVAPDAPMAPDDSRWASLPLPARVTARGQSAGPVADGPGRPVRFPSLVFHPPRLNVAR